MIKFNVDFVDGAHYLKCGLGMFGLQDYCRIMQVDKDQAKLDILSKGIFNVDNRRIWSDNPNAIQELADALNEVNDKQVAEIEQIIKKEIDEDRKFAWTLFVSTCGADMRSWSNKAMQHLNKDEFNWMEGYPSAPFDRFIIETIKIYKPDLSSLINTSAISSGTIKEFVKKHLH